MGKPNRRAAIPKAKGARFSPKRLIRVSASTCAPPVTSRMRPIIAPKPTSRATAPNVLPKAPTATEGTSANGIPATTAVTKLTKTKATKACILAQMINTSNTATANAAIVSRTPALYAGSIVSMATLSLGSRPPTGTCTDRGYSP